MLALPTDSQETCFFTNAFQWIFFANTFQSLLTSGYRQPENMSFANTFQLILIGHYYNRLQAAGKHVFYEWFSERLDEFAGILNIKTSFLGSIKVVAQFVPFTQESWNSQKLQKFHKSGL